MRPGLSNIQIYLSESVFEYSDIRALFFCLEIKETKVQGCIFLATNHSLWLKSQATRFAQTTEIFPPQFLIFFTPKR
jgi:hypothetical protein